jgi:hypothetical protein
MSLCKCCGFNSGTPIQRMNHGMAWIAGSVVLIAACAVMWNAKRAIQSKHSKENNDKMLNDMKDV